jgi:Uma2 family endonuclease
MVQEIRATVSVEEYWHLAHRLQRSELVGGLVVELTPPGIRHGALVVTLAKRLSEHVERAGGGLVVADAGFILSTDPPTVRGPDVAMILKPRVPSPVPVRFFPGAPDLAVEVLSPDDRPAEVAAKVADYLRAGTEAVWIVDPESRSVTTYAAGRVVTYDDDDTVRGEPPLPEFTLRVRELF